MKPIIKICIALSIALFLLGAVGVAVGRAMGVTPSVLRYAGRYPGRFSLWDQQDLEPLDDDRIPDVPEEALDGLEEALDDLNDADLNNLENPAPLSGSNPTGSEEYYEFRDIRNLDMDLGLCELHILQHEKDYIAVCADRTQNFFKCSSKGDTLVLKDDRHTSTKSNSMEQALILDLYLPEQEYADISIDMGAGNITLDLLSADTIELNNGAGTITIGTLSCRELDVESGVGEFLAESILASSEADIEIGTGTATISRFDGNGLDLECGLGNAEITLAGREQDYDYSLEAALGTIYLNHHLQEYPESHHGSHHEDDYCLNIHNGTGRMVSILCAMGNAELNFTEE